MSNDPDFDNDSEDNAKEQNSEMFSVPSPSTPSMADSMSALFGAKGLPTGVEILASSETKNKYAIIATKGNRKLALCSSLVAVKNSTPFFALKVRLLDAGEEESTANSFGLTEPEPGAYDTIKGMILFERAKSLMVALLPLPSSPSELTAYIFEQEVPSIVGEALKALVAKAGGKMVVADEVLYELIAIDTNNLPSKPKSLFSPESVLIALGLKTNGKEA